MTYFTLEKKKKENRSNHSPLPQKKVLAALRLLNGFHITVDVHLYPPPFFHINLSPPPVVVLYCRNSGKSFLDDLTTSDRISSNVRLFVLRAIEKTQRHTRVLLSCSMMMILLNYAVPIF